MYTIMELKETIGRMHPEIKAQNLSIDVRFEGEKDAYLVTVRRGGEELTTYLDRAAADACMNGTVCVHLGVQIAQFLKNLDERVAFGRKAA